MKITIVAMVNDTENLVSFQTPYGSAVGRWSDPALPVPGDFDVEIEIDEGGECLPWSTPGPQIWREGGLNHFVGDVESISDDVVVVRLGGSIIIVEVDSPGKANIEVGSVAVITVADRELTLYPYQM